MTFFEGREILRITPPPFPTHADPPPSPYPPPPSPFPPFPLFASPPSSRLRFQTSCNFNHPPKKKKVATGSTTF
jgi:hypothetical protein